MTTLVDIQQEYIKRRCKKDPLYFINNFVYTLSFSDKNPSGKLMKFKLYDFQESFINELTWSFQNKQDIVLDKSRDMGVTWLNVSWDVWAWLFLDNFQCLWGSKKEDDVDSGGNPKTMFGKADIILQNLPSFLLPKGWEPYNHRNFMRMKNPENGNIISGESANPHFSRSGRFSKIFLDEFAFWEFAEAVWSATGDSSRYRVIVSTPHGMSNMFADIRFGGNIKHIEMHWRLHPEKGKDAWYDEAQLRWRSPWYDKEIKRRLTSKDASIKNIQQELDISYIQSGDPVFPAATLTRYLIKQRHPIFGENYAIGADVSQGIEGGDLSAFTVLCKSTGEQVFAWGGKCSVEEFAWKLIEFGNEYNEALLGVEINNGGLAVLNVVKKHYRKVYYQRRWDKQTDRTTNNIGWHTNKKTKSIMITELQAAIIMKEIKISDEKTIDELMVYETDGTDKYGAPKGKHDDYLMALAIAWQVLKDVKIPLPEDERYRRERKKQAKTKKRFVSSVCGY